jgi:hypothetical protein
MDKRCVQEMKKKILLPTIIAVCTVLVAGAFIMLFREKPTIILELAIYDDMVLDNTYYFTLDDRGVLRSYYGRRYGYRLTSERPSHYMRRVRESSSKNLDEEEMANLMPLLDNLDKSEQFSVSVMGGWFMELLYNDRPHLASFSHYDSAHIMVVREIARLSPISVDFSR